MVTRAEVNYFTKSVTYKNDYNSIINKINLQSIETAIFADVK